MNSVVNDMTIWKMPLPKLALQYKPAGKRLEQTQNEVEWQFVKTEQSYLVRPKKKNV